MEKVRPILPTEMIRELLLRKIMLDMILKESKQATWSKKMLEKMYEQIFSEMMRIRRDLHGNAIFIIKEEWRGVDVFVQYKHNGLIKDAEYMMEMLKAEARGRLEKMLEPRH